jgi:hypothetical protein
MMQVEITSKKFLYKFETLVPFEVFLLRLNAAIPEPLPMLETLSKIFNGNAVKGRQRLGGACGDYGGRREVYTGFWWGNLRGKRPLGRPRRRWEDNIKMDLQKVGTGCGIGNAVKGRQLIAGGP